jgi:hypothetical protein
MSRILWLLSMVLGCNKSTYTLYELDDGATIEDTGDSGEVDVGYVVCEGMPGSMAVDVEEDGDLDMCVAESEHSVDVDEGTIERIQVRSDGTKTHDPPDYTVRVHTRDAALSGPGGLVERYTAYDDGVNLDWYDFDWLTEYLDDSISDFQGCAPYCSFSMVSVEHDDPLMAVLGYCDQYSNADVAKAQEAVCFYVYFDATEPPAPPSASCKAGSGTFRLVPWKYQDLDKDGDYIVMWRALQESGRGAMTGDAFITRAKVPEDHGAPLYVIHKDQEYVFDSDDTLQDARSVGTRLRRGLTTTLSGGTVGGSAPFVSESWPGSDGLDMEVDLAWTCAHAAATATAPTVLPQGYTFALQDVGCSDFPKQKVTARPYLTGSQPYVRMELYGSVRSYITVPLQRESGGAYSFDYAEDGFDVEGRLKPTTTGLETTFSEMSFFGIGYCKTGSYTIDKES